MSKKSNTVDVDLYIVTLIDIMGQNDFFGKFPPITSYYRKTETIPQKECNKITSEITDVRKIFSCFHDGLYSNELYNYMITTWNDFFSKFQIEIRDSAMEQVRELKIETQQFSDSIMCYVKIPDGFPWLCLIILEGWMSILSVKIKDTLANKIPIRGAITIGYGWEIEKGNFYGPALATAHRIESQYAKYPRIIIDDCIINFLKTCKALSLPRLFEYFREEEAKVLFDPYNFIVKDFDGFNILNYLSPKIAVETNKLGFFEKERESVLECYKFISKSLRKFAKSNKNTRTPELQKLSIYYTLLEKYFSKNLPFWGINVSYDNSGNPTITKIKDFTP